GDRPVRRVFGVVFPDVPVLAFEWETGVFHGRKTGLFGAVWTEDRDYVWAKLRGEGNEHRFCRFIFEDLFAELVLF
ncbi:MAG: hypothetical protein Q8S57_11620, partial [Methanoregula sp.]|nr:hypothetical protein [Methanoregula sp.]